MAAEGGTLDRPASYVGVLAVVRRNKELSAGLFIVAVFVLMALAPGLIAERSPTAVNIAAALQPPSAEYWFGTDDVGRARAGRRGIR